MPISRDLADVGLTEEELERYEKSNIVIHPGEYIRDDLEALGWSAGQLAQALGVPKNRITLILNGQRGITADTAIRLGKWLDIEPEYWLTLQKLYELDLARVRAEADTYDVVVPLKEAATA